MSVHHKFTRIVGGPTECRVQCACLHISVGSNKAEAFAVHKDHCRDPAPPPEVADGVVSGVIEDAR